MKKFYLGLLVIIVLSTLLTVSACSSSSSTTASTSTSLPPAAASTSTSLSPATVSQSQSTTQAASAQTSTSTSQPVTSTAQPPASATGEPQYGGTLTIITDGVPTNFGDPTSTRGGPSPILGCLEPLTNVDANGKLYGVLATSWDTDPTAKTITFHLRQGVKFQDGTPFNAAAVKWNLQQYTTANSLFGTDKITSMDVLDDNTIRLNLSSYSALYPTSLSSGPAQALMYSPTNYQNLGKDKAAYQPVGTGPYKFVSYVQDSELKFARFDDYWGGKPYLDGIDYKIIADPVTAETTLESGEADAWYSNSGIPAKEVTDLQKAGYNMSYISPFMAQLDPASADSTTPFTKLEVREALAYAIDNTTIAKNLGYGLYQTLSQLSLSGDICYNSSLQPRTYDVTKAKQLLASAGYANGFNTTIIIQNTAANKDIATAVQGYLAAVNINATLDIADQGRFMGMVYGGNGTWTGLLLDQCPHDPGLSFINRFLHSFHPGNHASLWRSDNFNSLINQVNTVTDDQSLISVGTQLVSESYNQAMTVPLFTLPMAFVSQKYVHTSFMTVGSPAVWDMSKDWMGSH